MKGDCTNYTVGGSRVYFNVRFRAKQPTLVGVGPVKYRFLVGVQDIRTPAGYANMVHVEHSRGFR